MSEEPTPIEPTPTRAGPTEPPEPADVLYRALEETRERSPVPGLLLCIPPAIALLFPAAAFVALWLPAARWVLMPGSLFLTGTMLLSPLWTHLSFRLIKRTTGPGRRAAFVAAFANGLLLLMLIACVLSLCIVAALDWPSGGR
jgi:hypothetical protein